MSQVGPDLEQAVEVDDEAALEGLRDQLAAYCEVVDAAFSKFAVKQQTQIWLQVRGTSPGQWSELCWSNSGSEMILLATGRSAAGTSLAAGGRGSVPRQNTCWFRMA